MEKRQNGGRKRYIVQQFVKNIADDTERLEAIKLKLAIDMKNAGIRIMEG